MSGSMYYSIILAFASGIFVRSFFVVDVPILVWVSIILGGLGLWWYRKKRTESGKQLGAFIIIGIFFVVGIARLAVMDYTEVPSQFADQVGTQVTLMGVVVAEPELTAKSTRLVVLVSHERMLVSTDRYAEVVYGDEITFTGKLQKPESFETEFGRTFNYPGYLAVRDIFYTVSFAQVEVVAHDKGNVLLAHLLRFKSMFLASMQTYIPEPEVGLSAGLLLGVKSSLGEELEADFRTTGIIHIVVLSGANIMLVVIFVMYMLALVLPVRPRAIVGIGAIILFALLVGLSATVVRASVMAILILVAVLFGRQYNIMRALFFAGAIMIASNPLLLVFDVGFQLSFLATLGLIIVAPQFESLLAGVTTRFKFKEFFIATVATQIAILPLLLYQIGQFSLVAIVVNMLVLPVVPLAMLCSFATGLVGFILPPLATLLGVVAYGFLTYIILVATWFADLPYAAVAVPAFPFVYMVILYVLIGLAVYLLFYRRGNKQLVINLQEVLNWTIVEESSLRSSHPQNQKERSGIERS